MSWEFMSVLQIVQKFPLVIVESLTCGFQLEEYEDEEDKDEDSVSDMGNNFRKYKYRRKDGGPRSRVCRR